MENKRDKIVRVSDVVDMPENREVGTHCFDNESEIGNRNYNEALNQISTLEVSPDKLREMGWVRKTEVELDGDEMHRILCCEDTEDLVAEWRAYKRGDRSYFEIMKVITKALSNKTQDIIK